jgi:hypothetical protein
VVGLYEWKKAKKIQLISAKCGNSHSSVVEIEAASVGGLFFSSVYFHVHSDAGQW